jgi:hypothetical protein
MMHETFAGHSLADPRFVHQIHRPLLEHAGAQTLLDVRAIAPLENHRIDSAQV